MARKPEVWLSVDPGETTGWALWEGKELVDAGQDELLHFIDEVAEAAYVGYKGERMHSNSRFDGIRKLVVEEWRVYPWVAADGGLDFDELRSSRGIGALEFIARHGGLEFVFQPATIKEPAKAAGAAELFYTPLYENRHANDAIMHGWYHVATTMMGAHIAVPAADVMLVNPNELVSVRELNEAGKHGRR